MEGNDKNFIIFKSQSNKDYNTFVDQNERKIFHPSSFLSSDTPIHDVIVNEAKTETSDSSTSNSSDEVKNNGSEMYLPSSSRSSSSPFDSPISFSGSSDFNGDKRAQKRKLDRESDVMSEYHINPKVQKMLEKMAYKGKGLGKNEQGILNPIESSKQKGRRGLGFELKDLEQAIKSFKPEDEVIEIKEEIKWVHYGENETYNFDDLCDWIKFDKEKLTLDNETQFCKSKILKGVLNCKSVFDRLDKNEMRNARTRSNPFETIRNGFFQNRAALKMANIDKMCDFMFTNSPVDSAGNPTNELLYFADVCAGPGGFSEYVLWRKGLDSKGFGFTLKRCNDFKLEEFIAGQPENFHPYYGPFEEDDLKKQGDVFIPENQIALREYIMENTNGKGVHFMMADGGFSVEGKENIQEILSKQLYLCQCLVGLMIVRKGGHLVIKLFDLFTPFSAGLMYLMYMAFDSISIIKPNTSRPANSERYLVCKSRRADVSDIERYMYKINEYLLLGNRDKDVREIVPFEVMKREKKFFKYLKKSNNKLGARQITGLIKIAYYTEHKDLFEQRQQIMRSDCLKHWGIPDQNRGEFRPLGLDDFHRKYPFVNEIVSSQMDKILPIVDESRLKNFEHPYGFKYTVLQYDPLQKDMQEAPKFYVGLGGKNVFRYENNKWKRQNDIILPRDTVVFAELVTEYHKEGMGQIKRQVLHIIDAFLIKGKEYQETSFFERYEKIRSMCLALCKTRNLGCLTSVRSKCIFTIRKGIEQKLKFRLVQIKSRGEKRGFMVTRNEVNQSVERYEREPYFFVPGSVMFFKYTKGNFIRQFSTKSNMFYYFNVENGQSTFERDMVNRRDHLGTFVENFKDAAVCPVSEQGPLRFEDVIDFLKPKLLV